MPGGALTANTQMMRDNKCLDKYGDCINAMREVVAKGGFGTSVTPVSQFYFQQSFANAMQGPWKKITEGYGKMVLGYFGKTPTTPDAEIVKIAQEQLGLEPTTEAVEDINNKNPKLGIAAATAQLQEAGIEVTDENIFIVAACGDKGLNFLKGDRPNGIRYVEAEAPKKAAANGVYTATVDGKAVKVDAAANGSDYTVTVNGKSFKVQVAEGAATVAPAAAAAPAGNGAGQTVNAPLPGTVMKVLTEVGAEVAAGDTLLILEAVKMENEIQAECAGIVREIKVAAGNTVQADDVLVVIEPK
jgi:pyruvate carboxylase subunit B